MCRYDNPKALVPLNKFQQIGNAVSPRLARAMGECHSKPAGEARQ